MPGRSRNFVKITRLISIGFHISGLPLQRDSYTFRKCSQHAGLAGGTPDDVTHILRARVSADIDGGR